MDTVLVVVAEGVGVGRLEELLGSGTGLGTVGVMDGQQEVEQAVHQVVVRMAEAGQGGVLGLADDEVAGGAGFVLDGLLVLA